MYAGEVLTLLAGLLLVPVGRCWSPGTPGRSQPEKGPTTSVGTSLQLQCPPCDRIHCSPRRARHLQCRGGVTRGICNCCPVCAKTEGEPCGGEYGYLGRCDRGLRCRPAADSLQLVATHKKPVGTCQPVPRELLDEGVVPSYCQPKCTPDFCKTNRKAICAAVGNAVVKKRCQGSCQHTSCSACRYVRDEPDCVKCRKDDFPCMKRFAKCVKNAYCTRQKYPCKPLGVSDEGAKFKCLVPDCLTT